MFPSVQVRNRDPDTYVTELMETMKRAHEMARKNWKTSSKWMKRAYDLRVLLRPYKEGDIVYLLDTASHKGKSRKLSSPWKGPGIITKKLSVYLYRIMLHNAVLVTNHDRMMPCKDRKLPGWIVKFQTSSGMDDDIDQEEEDSDKAYCS